MQVVAHSKSPDKSVKRVSYGLFTQDSKTIPPSKIFAYIGVTALSTIL